MFNPAFAGLDHESNFRIGDQFSRVDSAKAYNLFYATYDSYSDKLKGGIAICFQQGLIGSKNIGTTELGFTYAGIPRKTANGTIRFGFNTNILLATKQWAIYTLDRIMVNELNEPNLPGEELIRYFVLKPRVSFLWDMPALTWGISIASGHDRLDRILADSGSHRAERCEAGETLVFRAGRPLTGGLVKFHVA